MNGPAARFDGIRGSRLLQTKGRMMLMRTWKTVVCSIAAGLCLGATSVAKADQIAYMSANAGGNPQFSVVFGTIDLNTGVFSQLGPTAIGNPIFSEQLSGMAEASGTLYGAAAGTTDNGQLYTINPANGTLTRVGATGLSIDDFGSTPNGLFVVDSFGTLYSINAATGAATSIGSVGVTLVGFRALSTNANALYFADGNNLYTRHTSTGAATLVGSLGGVFPQETQLTGLLQENGTLYGTSEALAQIVGEYRQPEHRSRDDRPRYHRRWRHVCHWARAVSGAGRASSRHRPWPPSRPGRRRRIVRCQAVAAEPEASFVWRRYPTRSMMRLSNPQPSIWS